MSVVAPHINTLINFHLYPAKWVQAKLSSYLIVLEKYTYMFLFLLRSSSVKLFRYPFHSLDSPPPTPFRIFHLCSQQVFHSTHFLPALWAKGTIKLTHSKHLQNTWSLYDSSIKMEICFLPPQPSSLQHCPLQQTCSLLPCQSNTGRAQPALSLGTNGVQPQLRSVSNGQWCRMTVTPPLAS